MHHNRLYYSAKTPCPGKIWFSSYLQKCSQPIRLEGNYVIKLDISKIFNLNIWKSIWDTRFIIGMQLDINKSYILVMPVSLVLVRFSYNTQKCSRPIWLQGNYLIIEIFFKGKFPQNLNIFLKISSARELNL